MLDLAGSSETKFQYLRASPKLEWSWSWFQDQVRECNCNFLSFSFEPETWIFRVLISRLSLRMELSKSGFRDQFVQTAIKWVNFWNIFCSLSLFLSIFMWLLWNKTKNMNDAQLHWSTRPRSEFWDRDWNSIHFNFETKSDTEIFLVSVSRPGTLWPSPGHVIL